MADGAVVDGEKFSKKYVHLTTLHLYGLYTYSCFMRGLCMFKLYGLSIRDDTMLRVSF